MVADIEQPPFSKSLDPPLYFINMYIVKNFDFRSNLSFNFHILIDNEPVYLSTFSDKNVNFMNNLLVFLGNFKLWHVLKIEFKLPNSLYFSWTQLISALPLNWKTIIKHNCSGINLLLLNLHLIKENNLICFGKLHCRELYNILVYILFINQPLKYILKIFFASKSYTGRKFTYFLEEFP